MKRALQIGGIEYATKNIESVVLHFLYLTSVERLFQYFFLSLSFTEANYRSAWNNGTRFMYHERLVWQF